MSIETPGVALAVAINRSVRADDEWFDEPDDVERLISALAAAEGLEDPVVAAGLLAFRAVVKERPARGAPVVDQQPCPVPVLPRWWAG